MSNLIIIAFDEENTAFAMRVELARLQKEYLIEMDVVVVVTRDDVTVMLNNRVIRRGYEFKWSMEGRAVNHV